MNNILLMNMCLISNKKDNTVLVQKRTRGWKGITFPGGKIENNESIYNSVIREVKEETGLELLNLKYSGYANYFFSNTNERWIIFLFESDSYRGVLTPFTPEGHVYWTRISDIVESDFADGVLDFLKIYRMNNIGEFFSQIDADDNENFSVFEFESKIQNNTSKKSL